ncbi:MAG: DUF3343 domain-containing protein [Actinobacteria bacterium]|nr:DUF3343 domain-containing protein [Actinomycetota bacterium]
MTALTRVVLAFPSTHAAMAAEDALRHAGISMQVIPLPSWIAADCGLAIRLAGADAVRAEEELARRGVGMQGAHPEPQPAGPSEGPPTSRCPSPLAG